MRSYAGTLRIAPPHTIVPWEVQRALVEVFDLPLSVPDLEPFGHGVAKPSQQGAASEPMPNVLTGVDADADRIAAAISAARTESTRRVYAYTSGQSVDAVEDMDAGGGQRPGKPSWRGAVGAAQSKADLADGLRRDRSETRASGAGAGSRCMLTSRVVIAMPAAARSVR